MTIDEGNFSSCQSVVYESSHKSLVIYAGYMTMLVNDVEYFTIPVIFVLKECSSLTCKG